jgi:predicted nucleotidyltransferase
MLTREDVLKILHDSKNRLAEKYGVTKLGLFGSFARNEATEESDVDICFDTAQPEPFIATHLKEEFEVILNRSVDIIQPHRFMRALFLKRLEQEVIYV